MADSAFAAGCPLSGQPAARAVQTAQALGRHYEWGPSLAPGARAGDMLAVTGWPHAAYPAVVVWHQPMLGQVALALLSGHTGDLVVEKGGMWWFQGRSQMGELQVVLRAVAAPDWL